MNKNDYISAMKKIKANTEFKNMLINKFHNGRKQKAQLQSYLKGADMTEEKYWNQVEDIVSSNIAISKYKEKMKEEYKKDMGIEGSNFNIKEFNTYFDNYIEDEKSKANIKILK
jgi:hypothetical protein